MAWTYPPGGLGLSGRGAEGFSGPPGCPGADTGRNRLFFIVSGVCVPTMVRGSEVEEWMEAESSDIARETEEPLNILSMVSPSARAERNPIPPPVPSDVRLELDVLTVRWWPRPPVTPPPPGPWE